MSLFCGKKCECKRRCKAAFGPMPDIEKACRNACKTDPGITTKEFACSGNWIKQEIAFGAYGIDLCGGDSQTIESWLDPLGSQEADAERFNQVIDLFLIVLIVGAAIAGIYFISK